MNNPYMSAALRRVILWLGMSLSVMVPTHEGHAQVVGIAAIVNEDIITTSDVIERAKLLIATGSGQTDNAARQRAAGQALKMLINETLQMQEARKLSVTVTEDEITQSILTLEQARGKEPGSLRHFLQEQTIDATTMENQVRAQIAWNKVVTSRLRRNVSISEDEVSRAQIAELHAPGASHYHIAALSVPIQDAPEQSAELAAGLLAQLSSGVPFAVVARQASQNNQVLVQPSLWIAEESLEPPIAAALRGLSPGQVTKPLRSRNSYQIIQYRDKREIKPLPPTTELILRDTLLPLKTSDDDKNFTKLLALSSQLRNDARICSVQDIKELLPPEITEENAESLSSSIESQFMFGQLHKLPPQIIPLVVTLQVGETSEPIATPEGLRMMTLCEKIVPTAGLGDRETLRQKLLSEKVDLEAVKHLRNLKRDAFIEVKTPTGRS